MVQTLERRPRISSSLPLSMLLVGLLSLLLAAINLQRVLPASEWLDALSSQQPGSIQELLFAWAALPRLAVAFLCGTALSLSGLLFQQSLRNPLAEPTTLGTSAGAQAALLASLVWAPGLLGIGQGPIAIIGAALATATVFGICSRAGRSPISIILAGLVVNLTLGTICAIIILLYPEQSEDLAQWQTGRLEQTGWMPALCLGLCSLTGWAITAFLCRSLRLLEMEDAVAISLGMKPAWLRGISLAIAIIVAGTVVATIGTIGFIGLAVPALARALGARDLRALVLWAPLLGGLLLVLADQIVQLPAFLNGHFPTGTLASLLGAPVLLVLLSGTRSRTLRSASRQMTSSRLLIRPRHLLGIILITLVLLAVSLVLGRGPSGWEWSTDVELIKRWRLMRVEASLSAGILLGISGVLIQRVTANPMASPEVMGISAGATLGAIALLFVSTTFTSGDLFAACAIGSLLVTSAIVILARRANFAPDRIILIGIALSTIVGAIGAFVIAMGGPARGLLLTWFSGSTHRVTQDQAMLAATVATLAMVVAPLFRRRLEVLELGEDNARALGLPVSATRGAIILYSAISTAAATIIVGPASFVGLLAPHMVRQFGIHRPLPQIFASAFAGGALMLVADWLGRTLIFPWQMPAALLTALIGGPLFLYSMRQQR
ncbi:Fe3+-hydroxamate ABC transporter permease FhuB [Rhizobium wenxiniae]|uniref:Iron complex transport system permease protein n=1 Tax=Rhizobium wenxiniae TaxID=1737357 RepID=A0A7X0D3C6_9HYPH|nr:Fe(3+)-hydroxamate ABC transporter permease FhuB [Rhizobium wenxiniae]MBB6166003.1 iron complex transport system permease protein [Rhizobium wenxiniae]GGG20577.1 Fe3+-hydroxamate ABC transporter permease FhuB [Rhizobium wenxiniae]